MMGVTAYLPAYIQGAMGCSPSSSAIVLAAMSVVWVLGSATAGLCLPHRTYRCIATLGALTLIAGAATLITMTPTRGLAWSAVGAILVGVGMGFCNTTFMVSVQTSVGWRQRGAATSSTMFLRFLGQSFGAPVFGAVLNASLIAGPLGVAGVLDQLLDPHRRGMMEVGDLGRLIEGIAVAMRHAYLLTGMLAVLSLLLALTYPIGLGPGRQAHQP
jgi:hypothetical protein